MSQTAPPSLPSTMSQAQPSHYPIPILHHDHQEQDPPVYFFSTHHLPTRPPPPRTPCLELQHLSNRLTYWNSLHAYRTGAEYLFQNYYRESPVGPEILWALPPLTTNVEYLSTTSGIDAKVMETPINAQLDLQSDSIKRKREEDHHHEDEDSGTPSLTGSSLYAGVGGDRPTVSTTSEDGRMLNLIGSPPAILGHLIHSATATTKMIGNLVEPCFKKSRVDW